MKRIGLSLAVLLAFAAVDCGNKEQEEAAKTKAEDEARQTKAAGKAKAEKARIEKEMQEQEAKRQGLVAEELGLYDDHRLTFDASALNEQDKTFLRHMLQAARLVEELNMLEINPSNLGYRDLAERQGTDADKRLFHRYQQPWCLTSPDPLCNALASAPPKAIGLFFWPDGMKDEELEAMKQAPNAKDLLSPFTLVRRTGDKQWAAIPFAKDPVLGPRMRALSASLKAAAKYADTPSLAKFLESRAAAFVADSPFPYDESDYDWIAIDSKWEVTCGPYEVYKEPWQTKAFFEMFVGLVNPQVTGVLAKFRGELQAMENAFAKHVGIPGYQSRKLDPRIAVRAVDVIMASGDGRGQQGATAAFHLPNRGKSVDEGLYKKIMAVNHATAFEPIYKARAAQILDEAQQARVSGMADIVGTTFHEFAHGFGAHDEMEITTKSGEKTTVHKALKDLTSLFEEAKADAVGLWLVEQQQKKRAVNQVQIEERYTSHIIHAVGLLQYPLEGVYPRMVAMQLGSYMDAGALVYDATAGRLRIDYAKMPQAVADYAKAVATIQLTGDYEGAVKLLGKYVQKTDKGYEVVGSIAPLYNDSKRKFKEAGIKGICLDYDVKGLELQSPVQDAGPAATAPKPPSK